VDSLSEVDDKTYPDHSCTYSLRPIFSQEDAQQVFQSLQSMTNRSRNVFTRFLSSHYMFGCSFANELLRYAPDRTFLVQLEKLVVEQEQRLTGLDKYVYTQMSVALKRAIERAEGKAIV
jgi:hypothetical protein